MRPAEPANAKLTSAAFSALSVLDLFAPLQSVPVALWMLIYGQPKKILWLLLAGKNLNMLFLSKKPLTTLITMTWSFPAEALARILPSRHRDFIRLKLLFISNVLCQKYNKFYLRFKEAFVAHFFGG